MLFSWGSRRIPSGLVPQEMVLLLLKGRFRIPANCLADLLRHSLSPNLLSLLLNQVIFINCTSTMSSKPIKNWCRRMRRRRRRLDGVVVSSPTSPGSNRVGACLSPEQIIVATKIPKQLLSDETKTWVGIAGRVEITDHIQYSNDQHTRLYKNQFLSLTSFLWAPITDADIWNSRQSRF